ncbi:MAG TPA: hypothetical protein VK966_06820 [Longimicrobiales bacterium]|nr:hypothetical protein [Longimicrobiales bacterium]
MSHELPELKTYPLKRLDGFPRGLMIAAGVLALVGIIGFAMGLAADADRAWRAYLFNWIQFAGLAQGAVILGAVVTIAKGVWSRPIRRVALSFVAFLPLAYLILFPPIVIWGADHILPWMHQDVGGKAAYLNLPFLTARNLLALAALLVVSLIFAYWALRPDAGLAKDAGWGGFGRLTRGWRGQETEEFRSHSKLAKLAPTLILVYAVAWTFIAFDFIMSLDPHWLSTLIGPYVFMAAFLGGVAATAVATLVYRRRLGLQEYVETGNIHDLGKLMFAFCVFWAYLFWSQYLVIWYGNLPHEQVFFVNRLSEPYRIVSVAVLFMLFVLPFFGLLGATPKKKPLIFGSFATLVLVGLWLERYLMVYPTLYPGADQLPLGLVEVAVGLGFLGLLLASLAWFATRFPMLQVWQPASEVELLGLEVEERARTGTV